jgi:hypothetical protein
MARQRDVTGQGAKVERRRLPEWKGRGAASAIQATRVDGLRATMRLQNN